MNTQDPGEPDGLDGVGAAGGRSLFRQILRHAQAPIYVTSPQQRYLFVNRAWEELVGVARRNAVGRLIAEVFPPDTARQFEEANRRVLESGAPARVEEFVETARGRHFYHTTKFPIRDADGRPFAVGGISFDITERWRAEETARASAARCNELLDASPDGIAVVRDLRVAYVNRAFCALLGYDRSEELVGACATDLLADKDKERVAKNARDRDRGLPAPSRYEVEYRTRDGRPVPAEIHVSRVEYDGVPSSLVYVRDVRDRNAREKALRESEARLLRFFEATFEAIVFHENGTIVDVNQAAADLHRCGLPGLIGRNVLEFAAPDCREAVRRRFTGGDERPYEAVGLRPDGTTFPAELRAKNVTYQGRTLRVAAVRDLTEQKRAEQALQEYAERQQTLSRRLLTVQEEERRRLSHELHDEVGQILTGLRLTLERGERLGGDGLRAAVGEARELLQDLTGRVRDLSLRLRPTMLDDLGLLPALLWHFQRYTAQTGVLVAFRHEGLERRVSPEGETAAYRIVQEALTNVARHAGVTEAAVRISLDRTTLRLEIEDRGAGFCPGAAPAGCGLSGMRQRAALMGGRLTLTSAPGSGTLVAAEWPAGDGGETDGAEPGGR